MSGETLARVQRIAGSITPSASTLLGGVISGLGQRYKKGDAPPEWATVIGTTLTLAPLIANFPTDAARSALRRNACSGALNSAHYLLDVRHLPKAQVLGVIKKLPEAVWEESRINKRNWSAGAFACALGGVWALQAIPANTLAGGLTVIFGWESAALAALGGLVPVGLWARKKWQNETALHAAVLEYTAECENLEGAPNVDIELATRFPKIREAAEAVCEVPHANQWKILVGVGVGCIAGFIAGASISNPGALAGPYLSRFFPGAAGSLVVASKCGADLVVSCFPGERVSRDPAAVPRAPMWVPTWVMNRMPSNLRDRMSQRRTQTPDNIKRTLRGMNPPLVPGQPVGHVEMVDVP